MSNIIAEIVPIVAILATLGVPAAVIIVIAVLRYRQKIMLITRGCPPMIDYPDFYNHSPLLWGMVLTAVSAAGLFTAFYHRDHGLTAMGILGLTAGATLLTYWFVTAPQRKRERELYEQKYGASGVVCPIIPGAAPLLWGMAITAMSVAGIAISLARYEYDWTNAAIITLTAGVALLAYWFVTAPQRNRAATLFERKCGEIR